MDAIKLISSQQDELSELLDELCRQPQVSEQVLGGQLRKRQELLAELRRVFVRNESAKRRHFWPMVRRVLPDGAEVAAAAGEQRHQVEQMFVKIRWFGDRDAEVNDVVEELVEAVRQHVGFEAKQLRRLRRRRRDIEDMLSTSAERLTRRGWARPTRPHPDLPDSSLLAALAMPFLAVVDHAVDACAFRATGS